MDYSFLITEVCNEEVIGCFCSSLWPCCCWKFPGKNLNIVQFVQTFQILTYCRSPLLPAWVCWMRFSLGLCLRQCPEGSVVFIVLWT